MFKAQTFGGSSVFLYFCTHQKRASVLSIGSQKSCQKAVKILLQKCYTTDCQNWYRTKIQRYRRDWFTNLSLRNEGCKSASCAIYTLFYTRKYLSSQAYEMINWSSVKSSNGLPFFPQSLNTSSPHSRAIRWCLFRLYICSIVY